MRLDAFDSDVTKDELIVAVVEHDERHVDDRAFVATSRMSDRPQFHATSIRTLHRTRSRGMNVDASDKTSRVLLIAPPPPAGPFVYSDSTSFATACAPERVFVRAATRSRTSYGRPCSLDMREPCNALMPMKSQRISDVWTPVRPSRR